MPISLMSKFTYFANAREGLCSIYFIYACELLGNHMMPSSVPVCPSLESKVYFSLTLNFKSDYTVLTRFLENSTPVL